MTTLPQQLRECRHALGWSQAKMAKLADLNTTHYEKIEAGKLTPRPYTLWKLARAISKPMITNESEER